MMKRFLACLIAVACLLTAFAALAEDMKVIKVNVAVNMRQQTNTDSAVMAQVPLGTVLTDCQRVEGTNWYAVHYEGIAGYIREDFLESVSGAPAEPAAPAAEVAPAQEPAAPAAEEQPVFVVPVGTISEPSGYTDDFIILDTTVGGVRVIARQIFMKQNEYIMVVGLDAAGNQLWKHDSATGNITELTQTDCFMGGTEQNPLVMWYNAWAGLTAIDPITGEIRWSISREVIDLGASITYAVDGNGVCYIGGYYGPDPVAIDMNGNILWQSNSGEAGAVWLYEIVLQSQDIAAHYYNMSGDKSGWVVYTYDGVLKGFAYDY